jgi:peptidoglycan hydrolase-like protein with peptidoglycan-binding domain
MRRPLLLGALVFVLAVAALSAAAASRSAASSLTLHGPGATTYGHEIDFAGKLSPAVAGTRVSLFNGTTFLVATATNADGSYHLKAAVARPGPFHAVAAGVSSPPVTVRIVPFLDARLVGAPVAGSSLSFTASLRPSYAGRLQVKVKGASRNFSQLFGPSARVSLGTATIDSFTITVQSVPAPGFQAVSKTFPVDLKPPSLTYGDRSPFVAEVLRRLAALGYETPAPTQYFDYDVLESIYAFEKVENLDRTGNVDATFWAHLDTATTPKPRYQGPAYHIEVDKTHQVLYVVRDGKVVHISPVSTAGLPGRFTPEGTFSIFRKVDGFDPSPLGILYKPMYFTGGYAIHGNPSVPPYPASHGCVRVPNFVIERLFNSEPYGETVYVY